MCAEIPVFAGMRGRRGRKGVGWILVWMMPVGKPLSSGRGVGVRGAAVGRATESPRPALRATLSRGERVFRDDKDVIPFPTWSDAFEMRPLGWRRGCVPISPSSRETKGTSYSLGGDDGGRLLLDVAFTEWGPAEVYPQGVGGWGARRR
jgi:hypothetical protein